MAEDKEKTLQAAQKYADKRQYGKAVREYQKLLTDTPEDLRILLRLVPCYEKLGDNVEAGQTCNKIAALYCADGAYQKGLAALKQAQRFLPDSEEIVIAMAELYNALGLQHDAISQLETCLSHYDEASDPENYVRILQMMVRMDSENVPTRIKYAEFLQRSGDIEGATRQYNLALAQLLSKERYVDYIQTSRAYLKLSPKDAEVLLNLARIYFKMNRYADAIVFLSSLSSAERTPEIRELLITCYTKTQRTRDAVSELKALAHQYEAEGDRQDMIEDVWLRAQKLAPNDPEVIAALSDDDPPLLSDSALNIISPGIEKEREQARATSSIGDPNNERVIRSRMTQAEQYYQSGDLESACYLCLQIIDIEEQYLPALNMLSDIYGKQNDLISLAQCERKIAKAIYEHSPDEAARHILRAEKCTPGAWENYNLMRVLGLDPTHYGLKDPSLSGNVSAGRAPSGLLPPVPRNMGNASAPPPLPKPQGTSYRPAIQRRVAPTCEIPSPIQSISNDLMQDLKSLESESSGGHSQSSLGAALSSGISGSTNAVSADVNALSGLPNTPRYGVNSIQSVARNTCVQPIGSRISSAVPPVATRMPSGIPPVANRISGSIPPVANRISASVPSISGNIPPVSGTLNGIPGPVPPPTRRVSSHNAPSVPGQIPPVSANPGLSSIPGALPPATKRMRRPSMPIDLSISNSDSSLNGISSIGRAVSNDLDDAFDNMFKEPSKPAISLIQPAKKPETPAGIPDADRQKVMDAIQEIDFYMSLMLHDDAQKLLDDLIARYGDVDIIHDAKVRLTES